MKKVFFIIFIILIIFGLFSIAIVSYFGVKERIFPHTFLIEKNYSNLTSSQALSVMQEAYNAPFELTIRDRVYKRTYKDLGILLSTKTTLDQLYETNRLPFPKDIIEYVRRHFSQRMILPTLIFTQDFYNFTQTKIDFSQKQDEILVDNVDKKLNYIQNADVNIIDAEELKKNMIFHFGEKKVVLEPKLIQIKNELDEQSVSEENKKIEHMFANPVELIVADLTGTVHKEYISREQLKSAFQVGYDRERGEVLFFPDNSYIQKIADEKIRQYLQADAQTDIQSAVSNIKAVLLSRYKGEPDRTVWIKTLVGPNTKGDVASRYIEVDISQQTMYLFDQGSLARTYKISSGLYYPTPRGHFHIINKALDAYSDIYNVWMPYWMAFYYGEDINAYFGIHELPYWYADNGERKQRPRDFLGSPHTGGCISLDIGAAQEVYNMSYVGMDVYVFD